jgi:hypothetical protein
MAKVGVDDAMIARMWAKEAPLGFKNADQFNVFKTEMDDAFKQAGLSDAEIGMKGTSTTFYSENPSKRLGHHWDADPANLGDYDINITSPTMKAKLDELGIAPSEKYGVFKTKDINNTFQPLNDFRTKWSGELGRDVNFVGYPKPVARDATEYILRARGATNGARLGSLEEPIGDLLYGARPGEGLPGSIGVGIPRRPTVLEMENLTVKHDVEFAVTYKLGQGKAGGGGQYFLHSGERGSVSFPLESNRMLINHTHPRGSAFASEADMNLMKLLEQIGSPQRSSQIIPVGKSPLRFNAEVNKY